MSKFKRKLENWTGNFNYWTGGVQSCKGRWGWCSEGGKFSALAANLSWAWNQPELQKANENCLHMRISANNSILLSDRECSNRFIYACQVFAADMQKNLLLQLSQHVHKLVKQMYDDNVFFFSISTKEFLSFNSKICSSITPCRVKDNH
jgi:hypothetical protein